MAVTFFAYPDPHVWWHLTLYLAVVSWGSFIIGVFSIGGGALFLPALLFLPGMTVPVAMGVVYLGTLPMALARFVQLYRFGRLKLKQALPVVVGALPGAIIAQALVSYFPDVVSKLLVTAMAFVAGLKTQKAVLKEFRLKREEAAREAQAAAAAAAAGDESHQGGGDDTAAEGASGAVAHDNPQESGATVIGVPDAEADAAPSGYEMTKTSSIGSAEVTKTSSIGSASSLQSYASLTLQDAFCHWDAPKMILIGMASSFMSSLSGIGGPLILFPVMLLWRPQSRMKDLVGLGSPFAVVLSSSSAVGTLLFASVDMGLALATAVPCIGFALIGGVLQERMGDSRLKLSVGILLIVLALVLFVRIVLETAPELMD